MNILKFTLILLFALLSEISVAQTGVYPNAENLRSDTIDVLDYEIHLDITDFNGRTLNGHTIVTCTPIMANVHSIQFDLLMFTVDSVTLNNSSLVFNYNDTLLHVDFGTSYTPSDTLEVKVYYHGVTRKDPSGWGGVYFGSTYAFNLGVGFEDNPHNIGRYWFPCFDNFKELSLIHI